MSDLDRDSYLARIRRYAFALLVGAALLACSVLFLLESFLFVSLSRSNLCETQESTSCFEREPGVVRGSNGSHEMDVTPLGGEPERVVAYDGWNETPAPGTEVVLERWEGDEIAYVYVPGNGSRYKTNGAPDRENPAAFAVLLAFLAIALPVHIVQQRPVLKQRR